MKKVLITGANSFIGLAVEQWLMKQPQEFKVDTLDMVHKEWKNFDFSPYDAVFHVAGIAHVDVGRVDEEQKKLYYAVNTDLTIETARMVKEAGVKQFIFMSSAIVFGESAPIGKSKHITKNTKAKASNFYGDSKLQAENGILALQETSFNVVVLRPPMIYGKGCKGNYQILSKFARKSPVFPSVKNERSILYIENLCEFVRLMINNDECGIFNPQNSEYASTSEIVRLISHVNGKKIYLIKGFGWAMKILGLMTRIVDKAFGSMTYDMSLSDYKENYRMCNLIESIKKTEL